MQQNAPYNGGSSPGADLFFVDGDFTSCDPCSLPEISYPFKGDTILANSDLVVFDTSITPPFYAAVPLGTFPNVHPWSANQVAAVLEQDFIVALAAYMPMRLNTPYDAAWALGSQYEERAWEGYFPDGSPTVNLQSFYLVEEGDLRDIGGGMSKLRRKFATIPQTRSDMEQFSATFPGIDTTEFGGTLSRQSFTKNVMSRLQYDYFIFDDWEIVTRLPLFPNGPRLDASTGLYPNGMILPEIQYFADPTKIQTGAGLFIGETVDSLTNGTQAQPTSATVPPAIDYTGWALGFNTSNAQPAEIVAESSTFVQYMGNIWVRRTRFVLAQ